MASIPSGPCWLVLTRALVPWSQIVDRIGEHRDYQERLLTDGKLAAAGPFLGADGEPTGRGLTVLAVEDATEARRLAEGDPLVPAGLRAVELVQWRITQSAD